jgi:predicted transposase/invertase (TIGR01784 family)
MNFLDHFVYLLSLNTLTPDQWKSFLHYILEAGSTDDAQGFIRQLSCRLPDSEEEKTMMTIAEQLRQEGLEKGLMEGLERGIERGIEKGRMEGLEKGRHSASRDIARELLACGINFETVLKTTGLDRDELEQMLQ